MGVEAFQLGKALIHFASQNADAPQLLQTVSTGKALIHFASIKMWDSFLAFVSTGQSPHSFR
ncbi:MAG: hypothetical protein KDB23_05265, partial [Planctomycetales bacterium]|nr:hypothetical protein [Planctomycetales bacterium]